MRAETAGRQSPVSAWGVYTGFDSAEPRWRRRTENTTMAPTARNSLCQFWNDWDQNSDVWTNSHADSPGAPCSSCSAEYSRAGQGVADE